jgi:transposase InsO family protein
VRHWLEQPCEHAFDDAPMESFFNTLKTELVDHRQYENRTEAMRDIFALIEAALSVSGGRAPRGLARTSVIASR